MGFKKIIENVKMIHIYDDHCSCDLYIYLDTDECLINSLFVESSYRHSGLGLKILHQTEKVIRDEGYDVASLYVLKDAWMHKWYKRCGYEDADEECEDGYVKMEKRLI